MGLPNITLPAIVVKHKKTLINTHNTLHFVYWGKAAFGAVSLTEMGLYGTLAMLTVAISLCATCNH